MMEDFNEAQCLWVGSSRSWERETMSVVVVKDDAINEDKEAPACVSLIEVKRQLRRALGGFGGWRGQCWRDKLVGSARLAE